MKQTWITLMDSNSDLFICRVCGAWQSDPLWGDDGKNASFNICDCCGVEFGYEDATQVGLKRFREKWLSNGAKWNNPKYRPENWSLEEQLKNIPQEYR
ncbi:hypothetical protein N5923_11400 [Erwiniaceae bacterium BAC15a-03b]|uniref:Uncharacterized protein n=1 Tax=Winslowiella arboricola TaxID=2978220 RepID=A0A9J6PVN6_9GAMM|nr:hypothetical protein [Winslowiella arboricola]MCU5774495.1 hypothetical protein [Winslowiella arboricola]MCU5778095.1 hypothetical protein [Winslowiella arboricola]